MSKRHDEDIQGHPDQLYCNLYTVYGHPFGQFNKN